MLVENFEKIYSMWKSIHTNKIYINSVSLYLYLCKELTQGSFHEKFHTTHDPMKLEHFHK